MIRLFFKIYLPILLLTAGLNGCINLKTINAFSSSALESTLKFEDLEYSFKQNCLDNCHNQSITNLILDPQICDCIANEKADSVTSIIYHAVKGYFEGLVKLSDNKLTSYKTDPLSKPLTAFKYGSFSLEKTQIEAYSNISGILLRAFTDKYRGHQLKKFLKAGNEPIKELMGVLDFNLSANLIGKLKVQKQAIKEIYFDLTKDVTLSTYDKRKAVEEYYQLTDKIEQREKELLTYSKTLKKLAEGHQKLVDNIGKMNGDEFKEVAISYASDIQDLISEFNKIANK